jgi:uncharacterized OsmC-like protein
MAGTPRHALWRRSRRGLTGIHARPTEAAPAACPPITRRTTSFPAPNPLLDKDPIVLDYHVVARRIDSHGSEARAKDARIVLDTDMAGRPDAFNPAEMLLASLAACILKGTERVIPMLRFALRGIEVSLHGVRQDSPPKMIRIDYAIVVDTDESDARLDLLHRNLRKYGTIMNTLAGATELRGTIRRKD